MSDHQTVYTFGDPVPREQILSELQQKPDLYQEYCQLTKKMQEEFLSFCTGASGLTVCYDPFFKFIFDADRHPERLSDLLSAILKQKVTVKKVLPQESRRIQAEGSLLIMDIVVELEDGSLANVEIQKIAYRFPGPRGACYSSDLVLRQYSRVHKKKKQNFSYKDLRNVYTIVILEKSTSEFRAIPGEYLHHARQTFDTGLSLNLLQEYIYIPLDVFRDIVHNKGIRNELEAWLSFLAFDDPETIWKIRKAYPKFNSLYQDMVDFRKNIGEVLHMFSRELEIMDANEVKYMIDELNAEKEQLEAEIREKTAAVREQEAKAREQEARARELEAEAKEQENRANQLETEADQLRTAYENMKLEMERLRKEMETFM